jgi:phosphopantetheine attachment domain protein
MLNKTIKKDVYAIIMEIDNRITVEKIVKSKNLISDLGFNSIKMITFIVEVERKFGIEFDDDLDVRKLDCLEGILHTIEKKCELKEK